MALFSLRKDAEKEMQEALVRARDREIVGETVTYKPPFPFPSDSIRKKQQGQKANLFAMAHNQWSRADPCSLISKSPEQFQNIKMVLLFVRIFLSSLFCSSANYHVSLGQDLDNALGWFNVKSRMPSDTLIWAFCGDPTNIFLSWQPFVDNLFPENRYLFVL